jgi:hypothetical protein
MTNRYFTPSEMNKHSINDVIKNLFSLLAFQYMQHKLQYVRVDEKIDVGRQLSYKETGSKDE